METQLKENIFIEGFDSMPILPANFNENLIYAGKTSEIPEEIAKECVESVLGETKINYHDLRTYKDYAGFTSRLYPFRVTGALSFKQMDELWNTGGRKTTKFFHSTATQSILSACNQPYCIIFKTN